TYAWVPSDKNSTNITFALYLPFAITDYSTITASWEWMAEFAVAELNNDSTILPNTYINLAKYNSWDPDFSTYDDTSIINSGGYSMVQAMKIAEDPSVRAALGELWSATTVFSAEVFSQHKMPFCGQFQSTLRLSDKNKYPYYFRLNEARGFGNYLVRLLRTWKVNRVALIVDDDPSNLAAVNIDIEPAFLSAGIQVITRVHLHKYQAVGKDFDDAFKSLIQVDARSIILLFFDLSIVTNIVILLVDSSLSLGTSRYFFVYAIQQTTMDFYFLSRKFGLLDPRYVWFTANIPVPLDGSNVTD
ncbi:hypothetical protein HDU76_006452, partial [Blyttiomyces sp. JEL0837]